MSGGMFLDGTGVTPGSEGCKCGPDCEFPCWQRIGWAPPCGACGCPQAEADGEALFPEPGRKAEP